MVKATFTYVGGAESIRKHVFALRFIMFSILLIVHAAAYCPVDYVLWKYERMC